jgi:two-component system, NtrC family, sensor kinase
VPEPTPPVAEGTNETCLRAEIVRQNKIIQALMKRADRSTNAQGTDFGVFQTTIMLGNQVRLRTEDLEAALRENEKITRQLHESQSALLATARKAGMAEVANNVLHNVGNVLNGVNVSAGVVSNRVRDSKSQRLAHAVALMNDHAADLGGFLTRDEKGKLLLGYLNKLVATLAEENGSIVEELDSLTRSIDHIKEIIATQQSYAGTSSHAEATQIRDLLEDAMRMTADSMARHHVKVVSEIAALPLMMLDKHLVLQILVNLMSNAKHAMYAMSNILHQMVLRVKDVGLGQGRRLRIEIQDNGEGILPENLVRLFAHGFTTRKNGHGFGLHSCALAAKQMGGTLTAHSDGVGKGATFTLELPMNLPVQIR